jgi:hypothetical protein
MRNTRQRRAAMQIPTEALESRLLLSATLDAGTLTVDGTDEGDRIRIFNQDDNLVVVVNGERSELASADVEQIQVNAGDGNDRVVLAGVDQDATVVIGFRVVAATTRSTVATEPTDLSGRRAMTS